MRTLHEFLNYLTEDTHIAPALKMARALQAAGAVVATLALAFAPPGALASSPHWPRMGIHDGDNKIVWPTGCCDGDLGMRALSRACACGGAHL